MICDRRGMFVDVVDPGEANASYEILDSKVVEEFLVFGCRNLIKQHHG